MAPLENFANFHATSSKCEEKFLNPHIVRQNLQSMTAVKDCAYWPIANGAHSNVTHLQVLRNLKDIICR